MSLTITCSSTYLQFFFFLLVLKMFLLWPHVHFIFMESSGRAAIITPVFFGLSYSDLIVSYFLKMLSYFEICANLVVTFLFCSVLQLLLVGPSALCLSSWLLSSPFLFLFSTHPGLISNIPVTLLLSVALVHTPLLISRPTQRHDFLGPQSQIAKIEFDIFPTSIL